MIIEVTTLNIQAGKNKAFEEAIHAAAEKFIITYPGCLGYSIRHDIENILRYTIEIQWRTLEDHLENFRKSVTYTSWRSAISPYFSEPPTTVHYAVIACS